MSGRRAEAAGDSLLLVADEYEFWQLIRTLGRGADDDDFDRLVACLARQPQADITGFADLLAAALWALDTPAHHAAAETASDDVFLYIRCAVEHQTLISYETRSNTAAWGNDAAAQFAAPTRWLELVFGSGTQAGPPRAYMMLLHAAADAVAADPAWQRWWELSLLLESTDLARPETTVKKGRRRVQVHLTRDSGRFPSDDPEALLTRATDDLRDLFDLARERFGLSPLPPLPALPALVDVPAELFRPDPGPLSMFPAELREALMRGDLLEAEEAIGHLQRHQAADTPDV